MTAPQDTYLTIADKLRTRILDGTYTRELPTTKGIALLYGVSHGMAAMAVNLLKREGVVDVVHGLGIFVAGSIDTRPLTQRITEVLGTDEFPVGSFLPTEVDLAHRFGVSRNKLRTALTHLEGQGLLAGHGRRGRIVLAPPTDKESS